MAYLLEDGYTHPSTNQTWNWVIGSPGQWVIWIILYVWVTGSSFWPGVRPEFFRFSKNAQNAKRTFEMLKWQVKWQVIVRCLLCLLLDWNHWMSVHAMNFYFYLWSLKFIWPENTASRISRHLEFIIEQGHRVNWVCGSLDSRVTGSLGHKMWHSSISGTNRARREVTSFIRRTRLTTTPRRRPSNGNL